MYEMRDYQRTKNNKYILPSAVYHQTIWIIRDYYRMKQEASDILTESSAATDGMPHSANSPIDVVTRKAIKREKLIEKTTAIEAALSSIPSEYQKPIWKNILYGIPFPSNADRSTYGRNKAKFIASTAERLGLYDDI